MLWVVLLAVFSLLFGLWGYMAARSRGRSPMLWALLCAVTFFIGIAIVYSLGDPLSYADTRQHAHQHLDADQLEADPGEVDRHAPVRRAESAPQQLETVATSELVDDRRWRYLCEYHPRISEAVRRIEPLGEAAVEELKSAYLALNDATLLPGILRRIDERFGGGLRNSLAAADPYRPLAAPVEDEEPIDLSSPMPADTLERSNYGLNGSRQSSRLTRSDPITEAPPVREQRTSRDDTSDSEREQAAWRSAFDNDRAQGTESTGGAGIAVNSMSAPMSASVTSALASTIASTQNPPASDRAPAAERGRINGLGASPNNGGPANGTSSSSGNSLVKEPPREAQSRLERREVAPPTRSQPPVLVAAETPATRPPEHRTVAPAELVGARYLETFGGLHLFALVDGRVFVDRHEALGSLELARSYIDSIKGKHADA